MLTSMIIKQPYIPKNRQISYVPISDKFIKQAKKYAKENSLDKNQPTGSVIVKEGKIIGRGANGSLYHEANECQRVKRGIPTGERYDLCKGCHPKNHSERKALKEAKDSGCDPKGADLYLWGHWWCCRPCWKAIVKNGIRNVYLLKDSEKYFNKKHPANRLNNG